MQFLRTVRHDYGVIIITPLKGQYRSPARVRAQAALVRFTVSPFHGAQLQTAPGELAQVQHALDHIRQRWTCPILLKALVANLSQTLGADRH